MILVFFGVWKGKEGQEGFFSFFSRAALWLGRFLCWCVCVKKEAAPWCACCLEVMMCGRGALCWLYVVDMLMLRAWSLVAGAGRAWAELGTCVSRGGAELEKRPRRVCTGAVRDR